MADGFRAIAAAEPGRCVLIDANGPAELVAEAVLAAVRQRLEIPA
jgi:dTMP kinase